MAYADLWSFMGISVSAEGLEHSSVYTELMYKLIYWLSPSHFQQYHLIQLF